MSVEIAWKQNILVTDSYLLKLLLVVFGFGLQAFVCDFSRQNICSVPRKNERKDNCFCSFFKAVTFFRKIQITFSTNKSSNKQSLEIHSSKMPSKFPVTFHRKIQITFSAKKIIKSCLRRYLAVKMPSKFPSHKIKEIF